MKKLTVKQVVLRCLGAAFFLGFMAACGQKGDLFLPEQPDEPSSESHAESHFEYQQADVKGEQ